MTFTITQGSEASTLQLRGELDLAEADSLIERAAGAISADSDLILEIDDLSFVDSSGVRALVTVAEMLPAGRQLVLRHPVPAVRRVFDLVGLGNTAAAIVVETDPSSGSSEPA